MLRVHSCPAQREAALTRRLPVEQLAQRRIRAVPSMKQVRCVIYQSRREGVVHRYR